MTLVLTTSSGMLKKGAWHTSHAGKLIYYNPIVLKDKYESFDKYQVVYQTASKGSNKSKQELIKEHCDCLLLGLFGWVWPIFRTMPI